MKKRIICLTLVLFSMFISFAFASGDTVYFYVSPDGSDYNSGSIESPFKTIQRAKKAVKWLKEFDNYPENGVHIVLREGTYYLKDGIDFYKDDSGEKNAPVVYEAYENEKPVITGGVTFSISDGRMLSDSDSIYENILIEVKDKIVVFSLEDYFAEMKDTVSVTSTTVSLSDYIVSADGKPLISARYPNEGIVMSPVEVISAGSKTNGGFTFTYSDENSNLGVWQNTGNIYIEGYFSNKYSYQKLKISEINSDERIVTGAQQNMFSLMKSDSTFWFSNIPDELESPGEYYLDRENKKLYVYPLEENTQNIAFSVLNENLINLYNTKYVEFDGITFENAMGSGLNIAGSSYITVKNCNFNNLGRFGVNMDNVYKSGVDYCNFNYTGTGGVSIIGGRLYNLADGYNYVTNCEMNSVSMFKPTYSPGVYVKGVGNTVKYNEIHDLYHSAITVSGNENEISHNEIYRCLVGTEDAGAIYMSNESYSRRNVIENNYFYDLGTEEDHFNQLGLHGIYLDGMQSGQIVKNNVFVNMPNGIFVNGGGYNTVCNNVFYDVEVPIWATICDGAETFFNKYLYLKKDTELFETSYSELTEIPASVTSYTVYVKNSIDNNIACKTSEEPFADNKWRINRQRFQTSVTGNTLVDESKYVDMETFVSTTAKNMNSSFIPFNWDDVGIRDK